MKVFQCINSGNNSDMARGNYCVSCRKPRAIPVELHEIEEEGNFIWK
jgi:hypothetical protein